jgi:XTP/dITP diphosphohydrolase
MKKQLLIATGNKGKLKEFQEYFKEYNIECISTEGFDLDEPIENGKTFEENAIIKSKYYSEKTGLPALADDSGLCVKELDDDPGVYSARWAGKDKNFKQAIKKIENKLIARNIDLDKVTGFFYCALSIALPTGRNEVFSGQVNGKISFPARGDNGFGYDPIFIPKGKDKVFAEMEMQEKKELSHRSNALKELLPELKRILE